MLSLRTCGIILGLVLLTALPAISQTGYYRSVVAVSGDWNDIASWEYSVDNLGWGAIVAEGYPGELGVPTSVLVRDGDEIILNVSPANALGLLTVGEGVSGVLRFGNDATIRSLTVNGALTVAVGATINTNSNALHTLTAKSNFVVNGTFSGYSSATQAINTTLSGTTGTISGSGTRAFNSLTINRTGTTTVSAGFTIRNTFLINNTGTVDAGTQTITGAGATDTFQMTTGTFQIGGTNTFPAGFETITLSGGTVAYAGLAQVIQHQESDGGVLIYNNITVSESAGGTNSKTFSGNTDINGSITFEAGVDLNLGAFSYTVAGSWIQNGTINYTVGTSTVTFDGSGFQQINNPINNDPIEFYQFGANGGGIVSIGLASVTQVNADFIVTNNTTISSASTLYVSGNYSIAAGSAYNQTAGAIVFNGTGAQAVNVNNSSFTYLYFDNGAPTQKTITGNANVSVTFYVYNDASVTDAGVGQSHNLVNVRIDGLVNFQGTLNLSGTIYDNDNNALNLGSADLLITGGQINTNNAVTTSGNVTVSSGTFQILAGASLTGTGKAFTLDALARLNIYATNGFPTGFASYSLASTSIVAYPLNGVQTIRGNLTYGELELGGGSVKTIDNPITVVNFIDLNNGVVVNAGAFTHTIRDRIYNATGSSFTSTGTVNIFASDGGNYSILQAGTYTFNNLNLDTDTQTGQYVYDIDANLTVNGNITISNNGGSSLNVASFDMNDYTITNDFGDIFTVYQYVQLRTSGTSSLQTSLNTFASNTFNVLSTVHYNGAVNQTVTNVINPYGNLYLSGTSNKTASGALNIDGELRDISGAYLFVLGNYTHTIAGDLTFDGTNTTIGTSTITFDGVNQTIRDIGGGGSILAFYNVTFAGTGTKTLDNNYNIDGSVIINAGVTVDASSNDVDFYLARNWTNNGTFTQTSGEFYFDGTAGNQNIFNVAGSSFGEIYIQKPSGTRRVTMTSDLVISRGLIVRTDNEFRTGNFNVYVGGTLTTELSSTWTQNPASTLYLDGTTQQQLNLVEPATFSNIVFRNSGTKRNDNNPIDVNGNLTIESGSTFNSQGYTITVSGNWTNDGSYLQTGTVIFDGTNQTINASSFNRIQLSNSGTKTLGGGVTVTDDVTIDLGVTLDVSASNHPLTIGDDFTITGTFNARSGNITFNGNSGVFTTGGTTFNNLNFNKNAGQRMDMVGDLIVNGDLKVITGILETDSYDFYVAGSLEVDLGATLNVNNLSSDIIFNGTSGTHSIKTSGSTLRTVIINAPGATYELADDLTLLANYPFTLTTGSFSLNNKTMTLQGTGSLTINGGTFEVDDNAVLQIPNAQSITNNGGVFKVVGLAGNPARVQRQGGTGGYTINQTSGTFHALYYEFYNTATTGITISGGSIDATNNFSNGRFVSGSGSQYLDFSGIAIAGIIADNVSFGSGPTYNVTRLSGAGTITFEDATGNLAGEAFDNDGGALIDWTFPGGVYWDGGGDATTWSDDLNWSGNTKPTALDNVVLNHDFTPGVYAVVINAENAVANRVTLDAQASNAISLTLTSGFDLSITTNLQIGTSTSLILNDAASVLEVQESLESAGTITHTNGLIRFNGTTGSHIINTGGSSLYNLEVDANGATYSLASALIIKNDISLLDGLLDVSTNNYGITIDGDWSNVGLSTFNARSGTVTFNLGGTTTQLIEGGSFYNLTTVNGTGIGTATKQLSGNVDVDNTITIGLNTILDAQTNNLYVGRNWTNNASTTGFNQTGTGTVTFDGVGTQTIDNGTFATTFNHLGCASTGTVSLANNSNVKGNVNITFAGGTFNLSTFILTGVGGSNTFEVAGTSTIQLFANNFPSTFETINLASNSTVQYRANVNQDIYNTTYGNLILLRNNAGNLQTKKALGDLTVVGNLTIIDVDTEFNLDGYKLTLTGNLALPAGGRTIVWNGGTVEQNNISGFNFDADIVEWPNVILSGAGTKTLYGDINVTGDFVIQNGVNFRLLTNKVTATGGVQSFNVDNGASLDIRIPTTTGVAFPTNFDTYGLGVNSSVILNSASPMTLYSGVTYGNLSFTGGVGSTVTLDGNLDVDGNFTSGNTTLIDNSFDLIFSGADIQLNNYTASATSTLNLNGTSQTLRETYTNSFVLNNVIFSGSGIKTLQDNDTYDINGNITINSGVTVETTRPYTFSGATFTNNGTFTHTANTFTFDRAGAQSIAINAVSGSAAFNSVVFTNGGTKSFTTKGADINGNITIDAGTTLNLGAFDYNLAYNGTNFITTGTLISSATNITLVGVNPNLPANFTVNNLTINTSADVDLLGNLDVNGNLEISATSTLDVDNAAYTINLGGNFINNNVFNDFNGAITFDGSVAAVSITTNGYSFHDVTFNPSVPTVYTLTSPTNLIERALTLGSNATLDLNNSQLTLGSNLAAGKIATINGTLLVDDNASIIFDNQNTAYTMNVNGTLSVVGTNSNNATITSINQANTRRTALTIRATGTIAARYYVIEYLDDNGLVLTNGATVDAVNNFSDGAWANLVTAAGGPYYYMSTNNVPIAGTISNVSFGFSTTPTPGTHFNVRRGAAASNITFGGSISGALGGAAYESDPGNHIAWPILASATWTGNYDSDWNQAANWSSLSVPIASTDVTIPLVANNPKITTADALCKDITISNGALTIENGYDITIAGNLIIGTGTNAGALVVSHATSEIFIAGNWTRGTNGIFSNGSSTVTFNAPSGTVTITPLVSPFNNVILNGTATFLFAGTNIDINGNLTITQGVFNPSTNNYTVYLAGNLNNSGGSMNYSTNGGFVLDGAAQSITAASFDKLTVSGTLTKTFNGAILINDNLVINSTLETALGAVLDVNLGTVTIAASGTFKNTGGGTHTVSSSSWTNNGTYSGTGTIKFDGGTQTINASSFAAVEFAGTGVKYLGGNLTLSGDLMLRSGFSRLELGTYTITHSGAATMTVEGNQTIYVNGADNFPSGFGTYALDATSNVQYRSTSNQTVRGGLSYGNLILLNANTKTLGGNITVKTDLTFNDATLDVSVNNYSINIGDDWNNISTGSFIARLGDVVFDGSDPSDIQTIRSSLTGTKTFYKITLNKTDGEVSVYDENLLVTDNFTISDGNFNPGGYIVTIGGSFDNSGGSFSTNGTFVFNSTSGSEIIRGGGSTFLNLTINGAGTSFVCQDDVSIFGNFNVTNGTFDGNGKAISIGNNAADIITVDATYIIGANGSLKLGNTVNFTVNASGTIYVVGTPGNPATVTRATTGSYSFQVNGTIHAKNYVFEYMDANGIVINNSATINAGDNFSNGTFTNGVASGSFLRIENTQTLTMDAVNFPTNPGGAASNITKVVAASGVLTLSNASGVFAGETFDDDPNNLINWPTPVVLTWIGGTSSNWFTASNWSASSGPNIVPTGAENVIIAPATNQPIINTSGALANNLTVNSGATLTMNTINEAGNDLQINSNMTLNGSLVVSSASDSILIAGSWTKGASGTFTHGNSTVIFNGAAGSNTINNGIVPFYNVVVNATAAYSLASNTLINNNLSIISGTLDVSASNYSLTVGNTWTNTGTFNARAGTVTLTRATPGTVNLNNGASVFHHLNISGGASTIFALQTNSLTVNGNLSISASKLDLNSLNLLFGDGVAADVLNITGTLEVDANSQLRLGANATVQVQSGGVFRAVGSDVNNIATVTRNSTGNYTFIASSGATIHARYYSMSYMDSNGIQVQSGATIDNTNNFSDGTFSDGKAGGRYLSVLGITANQTITGVVFNSGPTTNVRGTSGTGKYLTFEDASGLLAGASYEDDDGASATGAIRWTSTSTQYTWTGATSTDWNVLGNWHDGLGIPVGLPDATVDVIIPNVANDPIISAGNANAHNVTIQVGGSLVINTNRSLTIASNFTNGGSLTIANGSNSTLSVGNTYSNSGTVTFGNASTVELTAATGIKSLAFGGSSLNNLTLNGAATFNLTSNLDVNGNLTITSGTLDVTASNYQITVAGNWTNNGSFTARSGRVIFDGTGAQSVQAGGSTAAKRFYNFRIAKSNTATLTSDIYVTNNVELNSGTFALSSYTMEVIGSWTNTNVTVSPGTSTTIFSGSSSILLTSNSQSFNHFTVNKTGGTQVSLSSNTSIEGTLTITSGTLLLNGRRLNYGDGADNMSITGTMFVDAGSVLGMHQSSSVTVNVGGTLRVTGTNATNVATVTRRATTSGWNMVINGTLRTRYAVFEYSGGNGVSLGATASLNETDNFSNTTFRNGTGTSYLTLAAPITTTISAITFNSGPTNNVTATSGAYTFTDYLGSLAGARYENDGGVHPGYAIWKYNKSQSILGLGTYNYGNEAFINVTANSGITAITVDYRDQLYGSNFNMLPRYFRLLYTGGTATGNLTFAYSDNELGTNVEANLKVWVHKGGLVWVNLGGTLDIVNNTLVVNGYTLGEGTAAATINKAAGENPLPVIFDGSEDFVISDAASESALPVELSRFEVKPMNKVGKVQLEWETKTETENYGFTVYKSYLGPTNVDEPNKTSVTDTSWVKLAFVEGKGNSTESIVYMINDDDVELAGRYFYRLEQIDFDGKTNSFQPIEFLYTGPQKFDLKQNYPNPFNPITIIPYDVAKRTHVRVEIFNAIGQRVQVLVNEVRNPGTYRIEFNATQLSSGMYIVRYVADGKSFVKKMMFVK